MITGFIKKEISCHRIDGLAKGGQGKEEPSGSQGHHTVFVGAAGCSSHGRHSSAGLGDTLPLVLPQGIDATKRESRNHGMGWVERDLEDDFIQSPGCSEASKVSPVPQFPPGKVRAAIPAGFQQVPPSTVGCSCVSGVVLLQTAGEQLCWDY